MVLAVLTTVYPVMLPLLFFGLIAFAFVIIPAYYLEELQEIEGENNE
jgi:hypothetical protein